MSQLRIMRPGISAISYHIWAVINPPATHDGPSNVIADTIADTIEGPAVQHWQRLADGRLQGGVCSRECKLQDGQRGLCFVRARAGDTIVLTTYGRSSGFCIDPI